MELFYVFNFQTIFLITIIICLISNNWLNISVYSKLFTLGIFCLKILFGLAICYYFVFHLKLGKKTDLFIYFNQAAKLFDTLNGDLKSIISIIVGNESQFQKILSQLSLWKRDFDYGIPNDNQTMIRIHLFLILLVGKSILNHFLIFLLVSFVTILLLIKVIVNKLFINKNYLLVLFILPSLTVWNSATYKEGIALSIHAILITIIIKFKEQINIINLTSLVFISFLHVFIKPIYLIAISPFLICYLLYQIIPILKYLNRIAILISIIIITIFSFFHNNSGIDKDEYKYGNKFNILKMIEYKQDDFFYEAYTRKAETLLKLTPIKFNDFTCIVTFKEAILNVFFSPSLPNITNLESIPFLIENLFFWFLILYGLKNKRFWKISTGDKFLLLSGITICIFAGIISPVLGTVLKFKSIGYFYLFIALFKLNFQTQK